jgi:hypothetical protein
MTDSTKAAALAGWLRRSPEDVLTFAACRVAAGHNASVAGALDDGLAEMDALGVLRALSDAECEEEGLILMTY